MARLRFNDLIATLGASLSSSGTTITFAAPLAYNGGATALPSISGSDYLPIVIQSSGGSEIAYLGPYTSGATTATLSARAQEGTTGVAHSSGDKVVHGPTTNDSNAAHGAQAKNVAGSSITNNSEQVIPLAAENFDTDAYHDTATNNSRITIPAGLGGYYVVRGSVAYVYQGTGTRSAAIYVNGSKVGESGTLDSFSSAPSHVYIAYLNPGDYVELATFQNSGSTQTLQTTGLTNLTVLRLAL